MKVLHISNSYMRSKVHYELCRHIDKLCCEQIIYVPESEIFDPQTNHIESDNAVVVYSKVIKKYHHYLYTLKIRDIFKDVEKKVDLKGIDVIHASTFFSDGAVALKIKKKYGIPFVAAVRGTDVNAFLKYRFFDSTCKQLIAEAEKIFFITPTIKERFKNSPATKGFEEEIEQKSIVLPNGIDDFWIEHPNLQQKRSGHAVLYVGRFMQNKNIEVLVSAINELKGIIPDIKMHLIGGGGELNNQIIALCNAHQDTVTYHGLLKDKHKMLDIMRGCNVFAMVSFHETFGLVYVEAMSQGLPVLYTKGQGIDGVFPKEVGERVNPYDKEEIKNALKNLLLKSENYRPLTENELACFDWNTIARKYMDVYSRCKFENNENT